MLLNCSPTQRLCQLLHSRTGVYFMEAHDGLSARIVEAAGFDGIWASSLALSTVLGKRDANEACWTELVDIAGRIADSVQIPVLLDGDNALGHFNIMRKMVVSCAGRGVAGLAVEDKIFPKRNSLLEGDSLLLPITAFQGIIRAGLDSRKSEDFQIIARTEALIAGRSMEEALDRAESYVDAGASAVLIHSRATDGAEILRFLELWERRSPIVLVPTTYHSIGSDKLVAAGGNLIIWGNHMLRAAMQAMIQVATRVKLERSVSSIEPMIAGVDQLFPLMNYAELDAAEKRYQ